MPTALVKISYVYCVESQFHTNWDNIIHIFYNVKLLIQNPA